MTHAGGHAERRHDVSVGGGGGSRTVRRSNDAYLSTRYTHPFALRLIELIDLTGLESIARSQTIHSSARLLISPAALTDDVIAQGIGDPPHRVNTPAVGVAAALALAAGPSPTKVI